MKLRVLKKIIKLLYGLSNFNGKPFRFLYETEYKKHLVSGDVEESEHIERVNPEVTGLSSSYLNSYFRELQSINGIVAHSIAITRYGKLVATFDTYPYDGSLWHTSFSMAKSVVGLAVGIAIDEGYMSEKSTIGELVDFSKYKITPDKDVLNCTVKELLSMTARVNYGEDGALVEADWLKGFMEAGRKKGDGFIYNSMCTFVLAFLVGERTGVGFSEYVTDKLFQPLGIKRAYFEKNAKGYEKGGFGLLITVEDMAKLGNLVLNYGEYNGKRIVSEDYVRKSVSVQAKVPDYVSNYNYGYQTWIKDDGSLYSFNGMFGQNVFIFPRTGVVIAVTGGDDDMFHTNPIFELTYKYFSDLNYLPKEIERASRDSNTLTIEEFEGKKYSFGKDASRIGLMPIVSGVFQGVYPSGLVSLSFKDGNMIIEENDSTYVIPLRVKASRQIVDISGDRYEIATIAKNVGKSLVINVYFLELASMREITVTQSDTGVTLSWSETPGEGFLKGGRRMVLEAVKDKKFLAWLISRRHAWLWRRVRKTLSPKVEGKLVNR